jgi:hypothetical protein
MVQAFIVLLAVALVIATGYGMVGLLRSGGGMLLLGSDAELARLRTIQGAQRCERALALLAGMGARGPAASVAIARIWPQLEPLLLEALPDCPPGLKPRLAEACAACSASCRVREVAQGLMILRNSLV